MVSLRDIVALLVGVLAFVPDSEDFRALQRVAGDGGMAWSALSECSSMLIPMTCCMSREHTVLELAGVILPDKQLLNVVG